MKSRFIQNSLISVVVAILIVFQACKKTDTPADNKLPTCSITAPTNAEEITQGEVVTISAIATDPDGTITEVQFFVDGTKVSAVNNSPYSYSWNTTSESVGNHTIKTVCLDNNNASASDEIAVVIIKAAITFTDPRDGKSYVIADIGNQTWFAQNINYDTTDSWWYNDDSANGDIYGRLYTWESAQTVCPDGWHLPSDAEWKTLEMQLGMSQAVADEYLWRGTEEGKAMKSTSGWNENGNGTNSSGFNGLAGGFYGLVYKSVGEGGNWWTSTEASSSNAWQRGLTFAKPQVFRFDPPKDFRLSVRCVKN